MYVFCKFGANRNDFKAFFCQVFSPIVAASPFTWQHSRRLASIAHGSDSISYTYDPDGIRTSKTVSGTVTKFHIMNGTLLGQTRGSDKIIFLYDEKGNKYGFDYNGTKYYYIFNVQGDVIGILNQAGQKIVSYTYDPWGKVLSIDGSEASTIGQLNPIRYRGYYYDTETGFYYLQSRYYDPTTRRFLNADNILCEIGNSLSANMFAYCQNNPINRVDPTGHQSREEIWMNYMINKVNSALEAGLSPKVELTLTSVGPTVLDVWIARSVSGSQTVTNPIGAHAEGTYSGYSLDYNLSKSPRLTPSAILGYSYTVDNINYDVSISAEGLIWQYTKQIDEKTHEGYRVVVSPNYTITATGITNTY